MRSTFKMEDEYITMTRGDTLSFGLEVEGDALDTAYFTVKKSFSDETPVFQKSLGTTVDGITLIEEGKYAVRIAPEDTENLEVGKYYYDLQIGVNGDVFTVKRGILELEADVTR